MTSVADLQRADTMLSTLTVVALLLVHFLLRPRLDFIAAPDLLVGGLLLAALRLRAGQAAALGFALGILDAAMALENLGIYGLVLLMVAFAAARSRDLLFADARFFVAIYLFVGTWIAVAALSLLGTGTYDIPIALGSALATAVTTTLVCVAVHSLSASALR
ncbi:MAG: rod shape-determining protein MreD [Gemmatimonadota bacterium]|nr:rod shape-determining protein MreD [Gemmatimonadota bacterium]